jgi:hypothetical protein
MATTIIVTHSTRMATPMAAKMALSNGVATLKWLRTPRAAWRVMATISTAPQADRTAPTPRTNRGR